MRSLEEAASSCGSYGEVAARHEAALDELDRLSENINTSDVVDVVGVLSGIKPASVVLYDDRLITAVDRLGLSAYLFKYAGPWDAHGITVSQEDCLAEELADLFEDGPDGPDAWTRRVGTLLGYPSSSIDYHVRRSSTMDDRVDLQLPMIIPEEISGTVLDTFRYFSLSPDHWREEVDAFIRPLDQAVRELTPSTYRRIERRVISRKTGARLTELCDIQSPVFRPEKHANIKYVA